MMKLDLAQFDTFSKMPKYQQLVNSIVSGVEGGLFKIGERLPSINEASEEYYLSRDTVERAYTELYRLGVITSVNRRGYFITGNRHRLTTKVLFLVGSITEYNKAIYASFVNAFGKNLHVDIYTYNYKQAQFMETLNEHVGDYHYYVLMPHLVDEDPELLKCLRKISGDRLVLLDREIKGLGATCSTIHYAPQQEITRLLEACLHRLRSYTKLNLVLSDDEFFPTEMISGFSDFCERYDIPYQILDGMADERVEHQYAYLTTDDVDLVEVIKQTESLNWRLGRDLGLISFQDSCFKNVLAGGITTFSNDPCGIGKQLCNIVQQNLKQQTYMPMQLVMRRSL
jgi:DNA-binding transcriptional regulator YhcF (GntR family)